MTKIQIVVCTNRSLSLDFVACLLSVRNQSIAFNGEPSIDRARSIAATQFLCTDNDILLFIDDDIVGWDQEEVLRISQHAEEKQSIVGGCYPVKTIPATICATGKEKTEMAIQGEPSEVRFVGTGFMAISRKVLEDLSKTLPLVHGQGDLMLYPFFQPFVHPEGFYLPEDCAFCQRCSDIGYKIWLDPSVVLGHIGNYVYRLGA